MTRSRQVKAEGFAAAANVPRAALAVVMYMELISALPGQEGWWVVAAGVQAVLYLANHGILPHAPVARPAGLVRCYD
jgi:hypothetical protein